MGYLLEIRFCLRSSISHESLLPIEFRCQTHPHFLETARKGIDVESVQDARFTILRANRDSFLLSLRLSRHDHVDELLALCISTIYTRDHCKPVKYGPNRAIICNVEIGKTQ